ncbi:hypothetical protein TNCV_3396651 [Trichonephila clavipes]|nr:hypothetical protein TNCV_3396651 [Trichonephila clavipes]
MLRSSAFDQECFSLVVKVSDHGRYFMNLSPVPLKTRRVGERCTINISRAQTSSRWCGVVVRRRADSSGVASSLGHGYVKSLVYADKPQTLDHLEDNIHRVIADIRLQMLEKVIENWTSRLDYIRASHGSPIP